MAPSSFPPLPTPDLVARLVAAERQCMTDWLQALAELPGNPFGIAIQSFGQATALVCRAIPAQVYNRVFGLTVEDREHIPAIVDFYAQHGASPVFDLNPYTIPPYWVEPNVFPALVRSGFYHGAFHQLLYRIPTTECPRLPPQLTIRSVGPRDADTFAQVYDEVWGGSAAVRVLIEHPRFRCYLAYVDGIPAGLGILHMAHGVGSMANGLTAPSLRGRGCQTALLEQRIADAAQAGCNLLVSQCMPGSTSQNNQLRVGFQIAGSKAWWVRNP
jgi:GNAT superfamily N-acetyltransferase